MIIRLAIRTSIALEEVPRAQLLSAMGAGEMLRMPGLSQGCDDLADDGFVACSAAALLGSGDSLPGHVGVQRTEHALQHTTRSVLSGLLASLDHLLGLLLVVDARLGHLYKKQSKTSFPAYRKVGADSSDRSSVSCETVKRVKHSQLKPTNIITENFLPPPEIRLYTRTYL